MSLKDIDIFHRLLDYDVSIVQLIFGGMTVGVLVFGVLINIAEKYLPSQLVTVYKYGKLVDKNSKEILKTVPKSWFRHFYIFGILWSGIVMWIIFTVYMWNRQPPTWFTVILDVFASRRRISAGTAAAALLGLFLLFVHCVIRLFEAFFISVYSPSRINILHYFCGVFHYVGAVIAIAAESPLISGSFSMSDLKSLEYAYVLIFLMASYLQISSSYILANLRKNKKGVTFTYRHMVPRGGMFELISSPHMTAEILIYMALTGILRHNMTWWFVFIWVLVNQVETALLNHWWYQEKFPSYPRVRKALIPFVL